MPSVAAAGQAKAKEEEGEKEGKESVTGRDRVAVYNSLSLGTCTTHTLFSGFANCIYKAGVERYSLQLGKRGVLLIILLV